MFFIVPKCFLSVFFLQKKAILVIFWFFLKIKRRKKRLPAADFLPFRHKMIFLVKSGIRFSRSAQVWPDIWYISYRQLEQQFFPLITTTDMPRGAPDVSLVEHGCRFA